MVDCIAAEDPRLTKDEKDYLFKAHFDFVVVNEKTEPVAVFELDGAHHVFDKTQIERDKKKDSICKKVGLSLIRIPHHTLNAAEKTSVDFANMGIPQKDIVEIHADIAKGFHAVETDPKFRKFAEWLLSQKRAGYVIWLYSFDSLIKMVREEGVERAIEFVEFFNAGADFFEEAQETSGLSENEWHDYGLPALAALKMFQTKRAEELGLSIEDYYETLENSAVSRVAYSIANKNKHGYSVSEVFAFNEELAKCAVQVFTSLSNLRNSHPSTVEWFINSVLKLGVLLERNNPDEMALLLKSHKDILEYLELVKSTQD